MIKRLRVEPFSSYLERRRKGPIYPVVISDGIVYVSGLPPFSPDNGEIMCGDMATQAEIVLMQLQHCLEAAGSSMTQVLRCTVYCCDAASFGVINEIYAKYFPVEAPARTFLCVLPWPGGFGIEIDCIAACLD